MATLTYILAAVILLGLCIFVHELGHLLGGMMVGIKAKTFSIGYGKGIIKKKIGDTTYQLTPIPFGGFCQFYGEDPSEERKGKSYEFLSAHPLKRVVTVIMGPIFNLIFGILLFFIMNLAGYKVETNQVYIPDYFTSGTYVSPAYDAGIRTGDRIIEIDGKKITGFMDIRSKIIFSDGNPVNVVVDSERGTKVISVMPKRYSDKGYYTIGVMPYGENVLVGSVLEKDIADKSGLKQLDEIKKVDGKVFTTPEKFTEYIRSHENKKISLLIDRAGHEKEIILKPRTREVLTVKDFRDVRFKDERYSITIDNINLVRNSIKEGKVRINNRKVSSFEEFKGLLRRLEGSVIRLDNAGGTYYGKIKYERYGFIGIETAIAPDMIDLRYGIAAGFLKSLNDPFEFIILNIKGMGMLFSGELDVRENLSGPIRIAKIAGDTAYYRGISAFIILMAKISVILMIMNLLPIPAVDGSFILFFLYEAIKGSPINQKILERIQFVGIIILITLGVLIVFNDLSFLPFFQKLFR